MDSHGHGGDIFAYENIRYDFSVNINPLGMPESVKRAVAAHISDFETYPDTKYRALRAAISDMEQQNASHIVCGNGAADLIYRLCQSIKPENVLVCAPSFSEYERAAAQAGANILVHRLAEDNGFCLTDNILGDITEDINMVFLCSPNNPTGAVIPFELIEKAAGKAAENNALLVLDECFLDFTDAKSAKSLILTYGNLVILKAFTKIFAMAGLRLGYILCSDSDVLEKVDLTGQCWSVSAPAQYAGIAACKLSDFVSRTRELISRERSFLTRGLRSLGLTVFSSNANFLLLRCALPLKEMLLEKGILIRSCLNFRSLDDSYFRVAVKAREANTALLDALGEVLR
ncbi:MAG: aminotransferase class I/II-fold pyridoxal phosphate-dependent enzyme [Clostridiales bacterium]|jgi:threonine-phosphate decarboxylase|nr:aminotransferase class I/II-fold pyridoxal phosphate-dependent enzyme [Clostridiales bacterium]